MDKIILAAFLTAISGIAAGQIPALYNNGAALYISQDTRVQINGDFINRAGSELENAGTLATTGNVINNVPMTRADAGVLLLEGTSPASIGGSPIFATNVTIDNPAGFTLSTPLRLSGQMTFIAGVLTIPDSVNAVTFASGASVNQVNKPSDISHINGFVKKEGNGSFTYPIGNGIAYQPVGVSLTANSGGLVARYLASDAGDGPFAASGSDATPLVAKNALEHWSLSPVGSATGTVTMYWDDYNNIGIANIADLAVAHLSNGSWVNEGANDASGTVNTGFVTSNSISTWSPFTLGSITGSSPLPVRLISFTAQRAEHAVALKWRIADAKAFSHFEVERSFNAATFEKIGDVAYNENLDFGFVDSQEPALSLADKRYYRLKLVDSDGSFTYSKIEHVGSSDDLHVTIYPNPAVETIHLQAGNWSKVKSVQVLDKQGRTLYSSGDKPSNVIAVQAFDPGLYFITLTLADGTRAVRKIAIAQ